MSVHLHPGNINGQGGKRKGKGVEEEWGDEV